MTFLRDPKVSGIKNAILALFRESIFGIFELRYQLGQDALMSPFCHTWHILHNEVARSEFRYKTKKVKNKLVPCVVHKSLADK